MVRCGAGVVGVRLGRLVDDLETVASADAAAFTLQLEPLSLTQLVQDTVTALAGSFSEAGLAVHTDLDDITVHGDPIRLRPNSLALTAAPSPPEANSATAPPSPPAYP
jgi:signal transduction histidine kinase